MDSFDDHVADILPLLGEDAVVVNPARPEVARTGGDFDCVVAALDLTWPLTAPDRFRVLNVVRYDVRGWTWHVDIDGRLLTVDGLDDPAGIGRLGFKTTDAVFEDRPLAPPPVRASYLTLKRLYKRELDPRRWREIAALAQENQPSFLDHLSLGLGPRLARSAEAWVGSHGIPSHDWCRRARRTAQLRRISTPLRLGTVVVLSLQRAWGRLQQPTGLYVLFVGPDGSGKSSVAAAVSDRLTPMFRSTSKTHWRPEILPRLGRLKGSGPVDPSRPHARAPYGHLVSAGLLLYYWADFMLGDWTRVRPGVIRHRLVVSERGWWDFEVDPARYRLSVSPRLVRILGATLRAPDVTIHMSPPAAVAVERKPEISIAEYERQQAVIRTVTARHPRVVRNRGEDAVDASAEQVVQDIHSHLHRRTLARIAPGWAAVAGDRFHIPRKPTAAAVAALDLFQPMTRRGRYGRFVARGAARVGVLRLGRLRTDPPEEVVILLRGAGVLTSHVAVSRSNHPGRYTVKLLEASGRSRGVAKLATDTAGREALARESRALRTFAHRVRPPLRAPQVLREGDGVLILEDVAWSVRKKPWLLPTDVASRVGALYATSSAGDGGVAHGDFAPWNLLETAGGWVLIDWEDATQEGPPFFDVFHYMTQAHSLLGAIDAPAVESSLEGRGPYSEAIDAYARAASVGLDRLRERYVAYLDASLADLTPGIPDEDAGIRARTLLMERFRRT